jgi:hypothetical protein
MDHELESSIFYTIPRNMQHTLDSRPKIVKLILEHPSSLLTLVERYCPPRLVTHSAHTFGKEAMRLGGVDESSKYDAMAVAYLLGINSVTPKQKC